MKSEGLILAGVLGFCALFGVGVSHVATPMVSGTVEAVSSGFSFDDEGEESTSSSLREDLAAHYPHVKISDEQLASLECGEETNIFGSKDCYEGPTKDVKKYGSANLIIDGKPSYVKLASMPAGAFLIK